MGLGLGEMAEKKFGTFCAFLCLLETFKPTFALRFVSNFNPIRVKGDPGPEDQP